MNKNERNTLIVTLALGACTLLWNACRVSIPKGAKAVKPFDTDKYLGKWYEIARMDFKFEKNLSHVTADYTEGDEGMIWVRNRGYDDVKRKWKESTGKARSVRDPQEGKLKVSFFGPFYAGYNVIAIDPDYLYALVAGNNLKYLWILSRTPAIPDSVKKDYLDQARKLGYPIEDLVWTEHGDIPSEETKD